MKLLFLSGLISFSIITASLAVAASSQPSLPVKLKADLPVTFSGNASWYGCQFHGRRTASGEIFDMNKLSAAHLHLPLISKVLVENPRNGKSAVVRVNDRGPYNCTRVVDLSRAAALQTGILSQGVGYVECTVLQSAAVKKPVRKQSSAD